MDRDAALKLMTDHVEAPGLRRHMLAVEAAMGFYAERLDGDVHSWRLAGLLHDFDWEIHPTLEDHPAKGAPILRRHGCPEEVVQAILAHNTAGTGVERSAPIDYALLACDEITGLIIAAALVRPSKDLREVKIKSVKKRWKSRIFAAGVHREEVAEATADFSDACLRRRTGALGARRERTRSHAGSGRGTGAGRPAGRAGLIRPAARC